MKINYDVREAMDALQLKTLRKHQIQPINNILDGRDTLVIAPTGSGKSAIFQVPALVMHQKHHTWTLVIEPTLSLMEDQVQALNAKEIRANQISGSHPMDFGHITVTADGPVCALDLNAPFLYITPERLQSEAFQKAIKNNPPSLVVVDEAHCVLDWGYTFRSSYLKIGKWISTLKKRPVIAAFTATAPEAYRSEICTLLGMDKPEVYTNSLERSNLILIREDCSTMTIKRRLSRLKYHLKKYGKEGRVVIYCATRKHVDLVTNYLSDRFPGEVVKCHAYMDPDKRLRNETKFIRNQKRIMVATTAFGMGVDVPDIRLVVHFELPLSVIDYYQQIGRAGRDGKKSRCVLLYAPEDRDQNVNILCKEDYDESLQKLLLDRLDEMVRIVTGKVCIMQQVLTALGEKKPNTCRHCTNCQRNRRG
ncbi:RecQ family ATP-dependent DNA helicase [uncultured Flavonifractor sp.]|uniref:RecQ family ATP-dependent DNA helicase n=1 Tax=uncultured Flavonifractor sp. TaxID=1193534 RepID=UPI00261FED8A|nr:RecQ family ATP-dependent DNA helicase [uncultured Flavonifractor sp.]